MFILSDADLKFIVETLYPDMRDRARVSEAVRDKPDILDAMIGDPRLAERVLDDEEAVVHISPRLLFTILLRQTRRDLDNQSYINEIGDRGEVIPVFESSKVADLLDEEPPRDYLADLMSSFSKTQSSVVYSLERGRLRKRRFSSMDMDDMIYAARYADPAERPGLLPPHCGHSAVHDRGISSPSHPKPAAAALRPSANPRRLRTGGQCLLRSRGQGVRRAGTRGCDGYAIGELHAGSASSQSFE